MLNWFCSALTGRKQRVKINNILSKEFLAPSGVGQGSHMSALLFLVYINDVGSVIQFCKFLLFADDFKLFKSVTSYQDLYFIQLDIINVTLWFLVNGLSFHVGKCGFMVFYRGSPLFESYSYYINNEAISRLENVKDLGVIFDPKLLFNDHVDFIVGKAFRKFYFFRRAAASFNGCAVSYHFV